MISEKNALISVIVPVYKVEPYLRCCIDSILVQTFTDFELVLVDDGSPDDCGVICDEYAAKDDRIVVIHQQNGGVSAARNAGIDWVSANSNSQWIAFIDSDDYIPRSYLEQLYKYAVQENADVISTWFTSVFDNDGQITLYEKTKYQVFTGREACRTLYTDVGAIAIMVWGKLIRRELLASLRFPVGKIHEDEDIVPKVLYLANKVVALQSWWYCYRQSPNSIIHSGFSAKRFDLVDAHESLVSFFTECCDTEMVRLAEHKKKILWADCVKKAWAAGVQSEIPEKYRLPLWKALWILLVDTVQSGGIKFLV